MKPFTTIAILVFTLVAILQLLRIVMGWEVTIDDYEVPVWASGVAFFVAAGLAVMLWREGSRPR
ncbi:MAG TPA: hypothetical protein VM122_10300 [Usitatibacter sp.]|nr:hypothetical protein [Usitatibacter sp.]